MTTYYVGSGGDNGNNGTTWALRKLTLNGAEDIPVVAGDIVYVGPGVYREMLTTDVSGGNTYTTGTVTVTLGSTTVEGSGTAWVANVGAGYWFHVLRYLYGTDGVTDGTSTFTSATGNFHANLIGMPIQILTKGAYTISAVASATSMTLADPNGLGWPAAGSDLTYSCMTGEGHYEVASVTDNDTLVLVQPWQGPTHSGLAYITFNAITYIADVTGINTDGVGGVVRISGSDNDQTATRNFAVDGNAQDYRVFRGFVCDTTASRALEMDVSHWIIEDMSFVNTYAGIYISAAGTIANTIRRCISYGTRDYVIYVSEAATLDDSGHVFENLSCFSHDNYCLRDDRIGGITIRNVLLSGANTALRVTTALTTGQTIFLINSNISCCAVGLRAATNGEITENYNNFWQNTTDRNTVAIGASSVAYTPLFIMPVLYAGADELSGFRFPWRFGDLSEWSQIAALAGFDERNTDLYGIRRPATAGKNSWGPVQFQGMKWETTTVQAGAASRKLADATRKQYMIPVTAVSTTISVYVRRETNYSGTLPQMIIKQPGVADRVTTDTGSANSWNLLTDTFTPDSGTDYVIVELVSNNTATSGDYAVYFDTLAVN